MTEIDLMISQGLEIESYPVKHNDNFLNKLLGQEHAQDSTYGHRQQRS